MAVTATDLRDGVVDMLLSEVGYTSGTYYDAKYCYAKNWRSDWLWGTSWSGLYCNRFISWATDQVMGADAAVAAIGRQAATPLPAGFAATWLQRENHLAHGRHVGFANAQPGDHVLFKLPGRPTNPTNHIGTFVKWHIPNKVAITVEGNLPNPVIGTTSSIGVHLHYRDITYVVGVYRPSWDKAATVYNTQNPDPEEGITVAEADRIIERIDTLRRERTNAHVKELANQEAILAQLKAIRASQTNLGQSNNNVNRNLSDLISKVPAAVWGYRNPGYPERDAHGLARDGATAKQGLRELAAALRSTGTIDATGEATVQAATDSDTQED